MGPIRWCRIACDRVRVVAIEQAVLKFYAQGRYEEAGPLAEYAVQLTRLQIGEGDFLHAIALGNLGLVRTSQADYAAAEPLFRRVLEIIGPRLAPGYPLFRTRIPGLSRLIELISSRFVIGPFSANYFPLLCRATEFIGAQFNAGYILYAMTLNNLAELNRLQGNHAAAEPCNREAMEVIHSRLGVGHSMYVTVLNNAAMLHAAAARFSVAETHFKRAVEITGLRIGVGRPVHTGVLWLLRPIRLIYGLRHEADYIAYIYALNNLAEMYRLMGAYSEAEPIYREALRITDRELRAGHPMCGTILSNLALQLSAQGDDVAAEPLFLRAIENDRAALGEGHPIYATSLTNLADLYYSQGNYGGAAPLFRQALEIRRIALGETHADFADSLHNLAALYVSLGDDVTAEQLYLHAMEIHRKALGEEHPSCVTTKSMLASLYQSQGRYAEAEALYLRAIEIDQVALGEAHPKFAMDLNNLALLLHERGDVAAAETLYLRALEIKGNTLGVDHPSYALGLNNLAALWVSTGRVDEARQSLEQAAAITDRMIGQIFAIGSEARRSAYLDTVRGTLHAYLSVVLRYYAGSADAARTALGLVLRRKAIEAEALATQREAVLSGKHPALLPDFQKVSALARQIAQKSLAGAGPEGTTVHLQILNDWRAEKERLESELARQIPDMNLERKLRSADRRAVALGLPEGVALVEFIRFDEYNHFAVAARGESSWKPARYLAFVLLQGDPDKVQMIDLGEAEPIDQLISDFRETLAAPPDDRLDRNMAKRPATTGVTEQLGAGPALRAAVFDKLRPAFEGRTRLLLAPDGDLSRVPFEILPSAEGRLVVDDGFAVDYLNCGRDVLRFGAASGGPQTEPLVAADPDYDFNGTEFPARSTPVLSQSQRSRDMGNLKFPARRLPASRVEGERVAERLGVQPWLGSAVLEGRLKDECRSPWILHLATHGFFIEDQQREPPRGARDIAEPDIPRRPGYPVPENPLLRAGLLLAGANTWQATGRIDNRAEDGLLTAEDIMGLDLLATELVVLSACETGLGQVRTGEGVFGLQRAFVLAGAKTLVMSLWAVHDLSTAILMESFYENALARHLGRSESLRQAQSFVRNLTVGAMRETWLAPGMIDRLAAGDAATREHIVQLTLHSDDYRPFHDPYYWGAFICQGDPRPLQSAPFSGDMQERRPRVEIGSRQGT